MKEGPTSIIYLDDIHFSLVTVKDRLKYHYQLSAVQTIAELFELLDQFSTRKKATPDLILLDLNMPDVDGFKVIKKLKSDKQYCDIPFMFLSSKNDTKTIKTAMALGAADYIIKPFSDIELIDCIEYQIDPDKNNVNSPIILAIDNNPSILKSIKSMFDGQYRVYLLQDPQKLKTVLKRLTPDLFILEFATPEISDFESIPIIRAFCEHKETPIVLLTSAGTIDDISAAVSLGASDYIEKPIDEELLREKAASHLSGFRMRRRLHNAL